MPGPFELLGLEARPLISADAIDAAFTSSAAECHPDGPLPDPARFASLNTAAATLRDVTSRLKALAALRGDANPAAQTQPPFEFMQLFAECGAVTHEADTFLKDRAASASMIARALMAEVQFALQDRIQEQLTRLGDLESRLSKDLNEADAAWPDVSSTRLIELANFYRYLARWQGGLREKLHRIAFE